MSFSSSKLEIIGRLERREWFLTTMGRFLGVCSALAITSVIGVTIYKKMHMKPKLELDYMSKVYGPDGNRRQRPSDISAEADRVKYETSAAVDFSSRGDAKNAHPVQPVDVVDFSSTRKLEATQPEPERDVVGGVSNIEAKQDAIAAAVRDFFEAKTIAQMLPLVRDARRVQPLMEGYYQRNTLDPPSWKGIGSARSTLDPGYHFAYVQALFNDRPPTYVLVEETGKGFFVDWESSVHYCDQGWQDFQNKRPGEPKVFRVLASRSEAVSDELGADQKITIKLRHPQEDGVLYGSFDRNDPRFRPLLQQLDACQWDKVPVILRLCYPGPTAAPNQVQIAGVEGKGWIILDSTPHS